MFSGFLAFSSLFFCSFAWRECWANAWRTFSGVDELMLHYGCDDAVYLRCIDLTEGFSKSHAISRITSGADSG